MRFAPGCAPVGALRGRFAKKVQSGSGPILPLLRAWHEAALPFSDPLRCVRSVAIHASRTTSRRNLVLVVVFVLVLVGCPRPCLGSLDDRPRRARDEDNDGRRGHGQRRTTRTRT